MSIFHYSAGLPTKVDWDAQLAAYPDDLGNGRPTPTPNFDPAPASANGNFAFSSGYEAPTMDADGRVRFTSAADQFDPHAMILFRNAAEDAFVSAAYLEAGRQYRFNWRMDFESSQATWDAMSWALFFQMHPGSFPGIGQWPGTKNPFVAMYIEAGNFELHVRGSTEETPTAFTSNNEYVLTPFTNGVHDFELDILQDYTGTNSLTVASIDGIEYARVTHSNSINHSGIGAGEEACTPTLGLYGGHAGSFPTSLISSVTIQETVVALLSIVYCTEAELIRYLSSNAVTDFADNDDDGAADTDVVNDCINQATEEIDLFLRQQYTQAKLATSTLVSRWAVVIAARFLCTRRGNVVPDSIEREWERIADPASGLMASIADGHRQLPGCEKRDDLRPTFSNLRTNRRYRHSTIRVTPNSSNAPTKMSQDKTRELPTAYD